jgi:hypothetical protein
MTTTFIQCLPFTIFRLNGNIRLEQSNFIERLLTTGFNVVAIRPFLGNALGFKEKMLRF